MDVYPFQGDALIRYTYNDLNGKEVSGTGYFLWVRSEPYSNIEFSDIEDIEMYELYVKLENKAAYSYFDNLFKV